MTMVAMKVALKVATMEISWGDSWAERMALVMVALKGTVLDIRLVVPKAYLMAELTEHRKAAK